MAATTEIVDTTHSLLNVNMMNITKLTSTNYMTWSLQVHALLDGQDLAGYLDGSTVSPAQTITINNNVVPNPTYNTWRRQDKLIYSGLLSSLSPSIQPLVSKAKSAADMWESIAATYANPNRGHTQQLRHQLKHNTKDVVVTDGRRFPQYMHLSQLEVGYSTNPVIGRIIRLWETSNIWNGNEIGTSFLLLDQKGDVIECFIHAARITKYNNIKEGFIYVIYGYNVISKCKFQITNNPFTINFTNTTTIVEVVGNAPKIPRQQLMLSNYRGLLNLANTYYKLPDVVGQIRYVQGFKPEEPNSTTNILVRLLIKVKPKTIVPLILWNEIAANFRRQICLPKLDQFTIVVTSVNPKIYLENLQLNSTSATRFFKKDKGISVKRFLKRVTRSK